MPNILELKVPTGLTIEPTDRAADTAREAGSVENRFGREAGAAIGGAISRVGGQIGAEVDAHIASQQISHLSAASSQAFADMTQQWNDIREKSDPNDTSVAAGFNEKIFQPWADKFLAATDDSPSRVREWAAQHVEAMRREFYHTVTADMGTRAADAVHQNIITSAKADSMAAFNNPSSLPFLYDKVSDNAQAQLDANPYMTASQRKQVHDELVPQHQKEVVNAAVLGMARNNPQALQDDIIAGKLDKYLDAQMREHALGVARERITQKRTDDQWQYEQQKRIDDQTAQLAKNDYITQLLNGKKLGDYANDPRLTKYPQDKENITQFQHALTMQRIDRSENTPHPQQWRELIGQLHDMQKNDPNNISDKPIFDALAKGKINKGEFASALAIYRGIDNPLEKQITNQMNRAERFVAQSIEGKMLSTVDANGYADALNRFELDGRNKIAAARNRQEDVTPLIDPNSKDFVFSPNVLKTYLPAPKEVIADEAGKVRKTETGTATGTLQTGTIVDGYRFNGGDPGNKQNWSKIETRRVQFLGVPPPGGGARTIEFREPPTQKGPF